MEYDSNFFDDLEPDLEIQKFKLDEEWVRQPQRYLKYAQASAYFQQELGEAEQKAKVLLATLKADCAEDPETCLGKGVKPTNDRCEAYAIQHPEYIAAKQAAIDAKYNADMALAAVFAMQQRKEALENLVKLQGMELYSEPKASGDFTKEATKKQATEILKRSATSKRRS